MHNKLTDLNNHLFEMIERLNDDDLTDEQLDMEIKRAKAMSSISINIIENARLALKAEQFRCEYGKGNHMISALIGESDE